jgi:hypothetical protein
VTADQADTDVAELLDLLTPDELAEVVSLLPPEVQEVLAESFTTGDVSVVPDSPLAQAQALDPMWVSRSHRV